MLFRVFSVGRQLRPPHNASLLYVNTVKMPNVQISLAVAFVAHTALFCFNAIAAPQERIPDDTVITLQRGNCEGGCPVYRIVIFADGDVIWLGKARVGRLGVVLSRIERAQVRTLIQDFQAIDYFHLENVYGYRGSGCRSSAPDMPMVVTSFTTGGLSKTLMHHAGCIGEISD